MAQDDPLQRLRQALEAQRRALEELEGALLELQETLVGQPAERSEGSRVPELLSIPEVCEVLGMGKSWTYRKLRSGEIPSIKLGRSVKVKREDLEEYLESQRHRPTNVSPDEE
jgi:excisionase family DNA binding protein